MTDEELIARLRDAPADGLGTENLCLEAADRIDALTKERDQHWDSFVHWHKQADDLTGQLAAARQDAKEAEVYAEEVEKERDDYAHKLMQANNTYTEMHLEIERLSDKLAKAVEALEFLEIAATGSGVPHPKERELLHDCIRKARATLAEIKGENHD